MRWIALAALAAVTGCRGEGGQAPPSVSERIEAQQRRSEEAFEQAREAQIRAREQHEQAEAAARRVEAARRDLAEAQRELARERSEARTVQQQAIEAGRQAARVAEESQRSAAQGQERLIGDAGRPQASASGEVQPGGNDTRGAGSADEAAGAGEQDTAAYGTVEPADAVATGTIVESNEAFVVVAPSSGERFRVGLQPHTRVTIGGRPASTADLPPGAPVRVTYRSMGGDAIASQIEVLTGGG